MCNRSPIRSLVLALCFLALSACQPTATDQPEPPSASSDPAAVSYLEKSAALADQLQATLGKRLVAALNEQGTQGAIEVCQLVAQDMTEKVSQENEGIKIRRTALRVRNPLNQPDPLSVSVLEDWTRALGKGQKAEPVLTEIERTIIVHRPIMTADLCLQCHGEPDQIPEETRQIIARYYPEDQATGYRAGTMRGAFRIEFTR